MVENDGNDGDDSAKAPPVPALRPITAIDQESTNAGEASSCDTRHRGESLTAAVSAAALAISEDSEAGMMSEKQRLSGYAVACQPTIPVSQTMTPGAVAVAGITDESSYDASHPSYEKCSKSLDGDSTHGNSPVLVEAFLVVEDDDKEEMKKRFSDLSDGGLKQAVKQTANGKTSMSTREMELADREAKLKAREEEIERQMASMNSMTSSEIIVEAEAVKKKSAWKNLTGGFFGKNKKKAASVKKAPNTFESKLDAKLAQKERIDEYFKRLAYLLKHDKNDNRFVDDSTVPCFGKEEVEIDRKVASGSVHSIISIKSMKLNKSSDEQKGEIERRHAFATEVKESTHPKQQHSKYVLKYLRSDLEPNRKLLAAATLMAEASILSYLSHEHIATVHGTSVPKTRDDGRKVSCSFFVIMDRIMVGETLSQRISKQWRRNRNTAKCIYERMKVVRKLASALDYMHSVNVIYFNLNPSNIGFTPDGKLKLFDFIGARVLTDSSTNKPYDYNTICTRPFTQGTHPYAAPEIALNKPCRLSADIYSYGIVLWEVMTTKEPIAEMIMGNDRPSLNHKAYYPTHVNDLMELCWREDPLKRPSMNKVYRDIFQHQKTQWNGSSGSSSSSRNKNSGRRSY